MVEPRDLEEHSGKAWSESSAKRSVHMLRKVGHDCSVSLASTTTSRDSHYGITGPIPTLSRDE